MELTKVLAGNVVKTRYEDLPEKAREATKRSILDSLGVMFPPTTLERACTAVAEVVKETGGREESTLVGFGGKAPCLMAAFLNGSLAHAVDYDDVVDELPHHPTAAILPAALAIAEKVGNVSGKDFITAIALGDDLGIRLASAPKGRLLEDYVWFPITSCGVFSATAAAGKLLRFSEEQMTNALGIALHRVFGITEAMLAPDSEIRAIRDAFTNKEGVLSALLAAKGVAACNDAIEKFFKVFYRNEIDVNRLISALGKEFRGIQVSLKPWPCGRPLHGFVQAALEIVREHALEPRQVSEVVLTVGQFSAERACEPLELKRHPKLSIDAKMSLPFVIAVALTKQKVQIAHFLPQNLGDSDVLEMAKK